MKRFDLIKTIQLVVLLVLTGIALLTVLRDRELYAMVASDPHVRLLCVILWVLLAGSFLFLFYDFNSYADLKRENLELDDAMHSDALTGIANRYSVDVFIGRYLGKELPDDMGCVTLELTNLSEINERQGHAGGDVVIRTFSTILGESSGENCFIGRNGGNKFVAIFRPCTRERLERFLMTIREQTDRHNADAPEMKIVYHAGIAFDEGDAVRSLTELIALSDRRAVQLPEGGHDM